MAISPCGSATDPQGRELVQHGTALFPAACYLDDPVREPVPWHWHTELEPCPMDRATAACTRWSFTPGW